jgi:hypothetical protein
MGFKIPAKAPEIEVDFVNPPTANRNFDYCARLKDGDEDGPNGYGATRDAAISSLLLILEENNE